MNQRLQESISLFAVYSRLSTHSGIAADVLGAGLDRISPEKQQAILTAFPRLAFKD